MLGLSPPVLKSQFHQKVDIARLCSSTINLLQFCLTFDVWLVEIRAVLLLVHRLARINCILSCSY